MKKKSFLCSIVIILLVITFLCGITYADEIDPNAYTQIYQKQGVDSVFSMGAKVLNIVTIVAASVSVIALIVLGLVYMFTSVEQKAEIKKRLVPFVIGAVIMFGASGILGIVTQFAKVIKP